MARIPRFLYPQPDSALEGNRMSLNMQKKLALKPVAYAVSAALSGTCAPAALAQDVPAVQPTDLDAVIVTARKRE